MGLYTSNSVPLGLRLSFYTPRFLQTVGSGSVEPTNLPAIVDFQGANTFNIFLDNIAYGNTPALMGGNPPGIHVRPISTNTAGVDFDMITIDVLVEDAIAIGQELFRPGLFFTTGSYVGLVPQPRVGTTPELFSRVSNIGIPNPVPGSTEVFGAFTLPNFDIVLINGMPHVDIVTPFAQRGEYIIVESPLPGTPQLGDITLSRTGVIEVGQVIAPIPLRGDAFNNARFVHIFFRPGDYFSEADLNFVRQGIWPIRSQAIWFRGHPDDMIEMLPEEPHFPPILTLDTVGFDFLSLRLSGGLDPRNNDSYTYQILAI